ncbi:MAG: HAMP domain-containing protein [Anaerolineales bacterium]|nr:HAMP domain-containing protein [Anaerolineales bacterium]
MSFHSIRWRIAFWFALFYIIAMAGLGVFLANQVRVNKLQDLENQLTTEAQMLVKVLEPVDFTEANIPTLDEAAHTWGQTLNARVTLIAPDGTVLGESDEDRAGMDNHLTRPEVIEVLETGSGSSLRLSNTTGLDTLYIAVPITRAGQMTGIVRVGLPLSEVEAIVNSFSQMIVLSTVITSIFAILLAFYLAERTTRPLRQLTEDTRRITQGEINVHPTSTTTDEVGELARAVNQMAQKLQEQIQDIETERGKLGAILRQMTSAVIMVDPQGRVRLLNAVAETMFGVEEAENLGKSLVEVLRHHQLVELWQTCKASKESQALALELPGKRLFIQAIASPLDGLLAGHVLLVFQDLTRVRRLETVRQDFISNISHELRTPLASLKALTETLIDGALEDPPAARRFLTRIETEVDSLTQIVQELLELSRIESGRVPIQFQKFDPRKLVIGACERLRLQAERAELTIKTEYPPDLPAVMADPPRMEQVLINLIHNAIKFTPKGGLITLHARPHYNARTGNNEVIFEVRDTGVGIATDDLPRIFERFYKADRSRSGGGTGLGLAIARHLVEAHKGRIWAESTERKGSTFYFSLLAAEEGEGTQKPKK